MKRLVFILIAGGILAVAGASHGALVTFDELTPTIEYSGPGGGNYENGPNMNTDGTSTGDWGETIHNNVFSSGGASFSNNYVPDWSSWDGWSYSNTTDTSTAGYTNQFSAYAGSGAGGSANYGVFFETSDVGPTIDFEGPVTLTNAYFTNTTYAYKAVVEGDDGNNPAFVKGPFAQGDWFKMTVWGFDAGGTASNSLDIYLADYRDSDSDNWYALDDWTAFDLSALGAVYGLGFELASTDTGDYGMNTPAYFAMDDLGYNAVPVPASVLLLGSGLLGLFGIRRRKNG